MNELAGSLRIDVVSDVVCPWCFVGKRRLQAGLDWVGRPAAQVRWHPFLLDPTITSDGVPMAEYLARKFGEPGRVEGMLQRLSTIGEEVGIEFAFDRIAVRSGSLDAHRLIRWAGEAGCQDAVVEALFSAFFEGGRDIGRHRVLAEIAESGGLDRAEVLHRLERGADVEWVSAAALEAQRNGVHGVPLFLFGGVTAVSGAQPPEVLASAYERARELQKSRVDRQPVPPEGT